MSSEMNDYVSKRVNSLRRELADELAVHEESAAQLIKNALSHAGDDSNPGPQSASSATQPTVRSIPADHGRSDEGRAPSTNLSGGGSKSDEPDLSKEPKPWPPREGFAPVASTEWPPKPAPQGCQKTFPVQLDVYVACDYYRL
jgi:hypothetical protein